MRVVELPIQFLTDLSGYVLASKKGASCNQACQLKKGISNNKNQKE